MQIKGKIIRSSNSDKIYSFQPENKSKLRKLQDRIQDTLNNFDLDFNFLYITENYQLKLDNRDYYNYPDYLVKGINKYLKQFVQVKVEKEIVN